MTERQQQLEAYALGVLSKEESEDLEAALQRDPQLRAELAQMNDALSLAASAAPPVAPSASLRERLLQASDIKQKYSSFVDRLTTFLDLPAKSVESILELARSAPQGKTWQSTPVPGIFHSEIPVGKGRGDCEARLLYLEPRTVFPAHRHLGTEWGFILQGAVRDSDEGDATVGDLVMKKRGTEHSFQVTSDDPAMFVVLHQDGGVEFS